MRIRQIELYRGCPVTVQSMLSRPAADIAGNVAQAKALEAAGCDIVRVAVPDKAAVALIPALRGAVAMPVVADIHFDAQLAIEAVAAGADKIRINPGNLGGQDKLGRVAAACRAAGIPIRVGVNAGSLEKELLKKYGRPSPEALCDSALQNAALLEQCDFHDICLSLKSSDVADTVAAYELAAARCDYPLHIGITEAGTLHMGLIKSAAGLGALLLRGIGDTLRVSLTADPVEEVYAALDLLRALGLRRDRPNLIACPTCGRTAIDLTRIAAEVEQRLRDVHAPLTVAVMGCAVNGPGEAHEADVGLAGGDGKALLFAKGAPLYTVDEAHCVDALMEEVRRITEEKK
ncbi:MAG: flavodoxin-dependent (E)-4-hydroxy-3-methylbut-2-enyl-diphosphate synthase [Oscillospiraceae bacterium]|nr:flavodoxin-dependent (E)-4-hydroxy-3-methylbut-2-enyl-diphosphate synthase [Oscillospiraceae bacterium]